MTPAEIILALLRSAAAAVSAWQQEKADREAARAELAARAKAALS